MRTIAIITGTRAEYGLLLPVMRAVAAHPSLNLFTLVTGTHLTAGTWRDIPAQAIAIDAKVLMQKKGDTGYAADVAALSRGIAGIGRVLDRIKPDCVLVLGDRIEAFAAASAAAIGGVRLAHIHGGDRAEGVADEAMRHAISKLAHLHFAATAQSRARLIRMGEPPATVFNVGSPAADGLRDVVAAADAPDLIIMQHPIGAADNREQAWMKQTLAATARLHGRPVNRLILAPNSDPGSEGIRAALNSTATPSAATPFTEHLPRERFLALLKGAAAIVGNSSAGLIEAAILRVPCINIGPRQSGREKPRNVIDCPYGTAAIRAALTKALALKRSRFTHPYGAGQTGSKIAQILANAKWTNESPRKKNSY